MGKKVFKLNKKPSNKISKDNMRQIRALAKSLPDKEIESYGHDVPPIVQVRLVGEQILQHEKDSKDSSGKSIKPDNKYALQVDQKMLINHERRLIAAFHESGWKGVDEYMRKMK